MRYTFRKGARAGAMTRMFTPIPEDASVPALPGVHSAAAAVQPALPHNQETRT